MIFTAYYEKDAREFAGLLLPTACFVLVSQIGLFVTFFVSVRKALSFDCDFWQRKGYAYDAIEKYFNE